MGAKHTPGPWTRAVGGHVIGAGQTAVAMPCRGGELHNRRSEAEANAHLIAAAPDLLEAARCALGMLTGNMDGDWSLGDPVEMLRAAIRKAEGLQSPAGER